MNLYRKRLDFAFLIGILGVLFVPSLLPSLQLLYFAPFLIILNYRKSLLTCLWGALFCGLILDLLSAEPRLGFNAINYILVSMVIHRLKHNFFPDSAMTLPILTLLFSLISTVFEMTILILFDQPLSLYGNWILNHLILLPVLNALYAFGIFVLPWLLFGKKQLRGSDYFTSR